MRTPTSERDGGPSATDTPAPPPTVALGPRSRLHLSAPTTAASTTPSRRAGVGDPASR